LIVSVLRSILPLKENSARQSVVYRVNLVRTNVQALHPAGERKAAENSGRSTRIDVHVLS
jgi:hypothetical protein